MCGLLKDIAVTIEEVNFITAKLNLVIIQNERGIYQFNGIWLKIIGR